jgi:hypothetical protein
LPCEPADYCRELRETLRQHPTQERIVDNGDVKNYGLQIDEISSDIWESSVLTDDIVMEVRNQSMLHIRDRAMSLKYGAFLVRKDLKQKFDAALIEMLPGVYTVGTRLDGLVLLFSLFTVFLYSRFVNRELPPAYPTVNAERLVFQMKHLDELFFIFNVCLLLSICVFALEIWMCYKMRVVSAVRKFVTLIIPRW